MRQAQLQPKQDVVTQWNSTFYTLECVIQIKGPLVSTLALVNPQLPALTLVGVGDSEGGLQHPETF